MTGRCTKLSRFYLDLEKEYSGTMRLGQTTDSYDADTPVVCTLPADHITKEVIVEAAGRLLGEIVQMTPAYSAVRVHGEPLHRRARRGELAAGPPRVVSVYAFEIEDKRGDDIDFRVVCSKGTYIRSLVSDVGVATGVGAHLTRLRRVRIGDLRVEDALRPDELIRAVGEERVSFEGGDEG
jgi:tRNA pseudouridine55 synthase